MSASPHTDLKEWMIREPIGMNCVFQRALDPFVHFQDGNYAFLGQIVPMAFPDYPVIDASCPGHLVIPLSF
jgi:hypothetical protein